MVAQLPSTETLKQYGRGAKLLITHKDIPDLKFQDENKDETLEVNAVNIQESTPKVGSDEHSTPLSGPTVTDIRERTPDAEGDKYSTPSGTKIISDNMTRLKIDVTEVVRSTSGEGDEHLTPSTVQWGEGDSRSTDNRLVTKQRVTKEQSVVDNQINIPKLG